MAKKLTKIVGCAALAGVSYAVGRVIGFVTGVGWAGLAHRDNPKAFEQGLDDGINFVKEHNPAAYAKILKDFPGLEEPETPDTQVTTNQPED